MSSDGTPRSSAISSPVDPAIVRATLTVARVFDELGIPYVVSGSFASTLQGIPRTTQDVDLVADLLPRQVREFVERVEGQFYVDEERVRQAVARRTQFNLVDTSRGFKVDVYLLRSDRHSASTLLRASPVRIGLGAEDTVRISSPEDVVIEKLRWYRLGGEVSERQWLDVLGVLKVQKRTIDRDYLRRWAEEIEVSDLLERALSDAGYL